MKKTHHQSVRVPCDGAQPAAHGRVGGAVLLPGYRRLHGHLGLYPGGGRQVCRGHRYGGQKVTDAKGTFTLDGVVAGVYNVVVDGPLLQPESKKETARWGGFLFLGGR